MIGNGSSPLGNSTSFNNLGEHNITIVYPQSQNYSRSSESFFVTVSDVVVPNVTSLTEQPANATAYVSGATYEFNATVADNLNLANVSIEFNGTNSSLLLSIGGGVYNYTTSNLAAGYYVYNWYANDTSGNVNFTEGGFYTVSRATSEVNLSINNYESNLTINNGSTIDLNGTLITGDAGATILLYNNGTLIGNGTTPRGNKTTFNNHGLYNITVVYPENQNYSRSSETFYVNVSDIVSPGVTIVDPSNIIYTTGNVGLNFTLGESGSCQYSVDSGATNTSMVNNTFGTEFIGTIIGLSNAQYTLNAYCNDTLGNMNNTEGINFTINAPSAPSAGEGGGGGGSRVIKNDLGVSIVPDSLEIVLVKGVEGTKILKIKNKDSVFTNVDVFMIGEELTEALIMVDKISLGPNQEKDIAIKVNSLEKGLITGKIVFSSKGQRYELPVVINVKSEDFLFDVAISVLEDYKDIGVGNSILSQINLIQVGPQVVVDVVANYVVKDFEGIVYLEERETFAVLVDKGYTKEFDTSHLEEGTYVIGLELVYPGAFASASSQFEVIEGLDDSGAGLNFFDLLKNFFKRLFGLWS